jgi:AraC-like DNA-binding protein
MNYKQYDPPETLRSFIKCFWSLEAPAQSIVEKQRIVPDGCMEMIFHYGDLYKQFLEDGSSITQPRCFVFGQITFPLEIMPTGVSGIIAARFQPDGFIPFSSYPVQQMENKGVPLAILFGDEASMLETNVLNATSNDKRIHFITEFLLARLQTSEATGRITKASIATLLQSNGQINVDELAGHLQINRRQLERKFSSAIGLSPKQLSKVIRLQATLKAMQQKQYTSLTSLAYENGYYDQAHFIKDFKEFTGISPRQFYAENLKLSALFTSED